MLNLPLTSDRRSFGQNRLFQFLVGLFVVAWFYFFATTRSQINWWIENLLVILFIPWFIVLQKKFTFSNTGLICLFLFLFLHIYGAQMSYTHNQLGFWFKEKYQLGRNPFDRFVHFNFGFLMAVPAHDYLIHRFKTPLKWSYILTVLLILGLATVFELIEFLVALTTDSETGKTYVATQGDVWDAQKDIALALVAVIGVMLVLYFLNRKTRGAIVEKIATG